MKRAFHRKSWNFLLKGKSQLTYYLCSTSFHLPDQVLHGLQTDSSDDGHLSVFKQWEWFQITWKNPGKYTPQKHNYLYWCGIWIAGSRVRRKFNFINWVIIMTYDCKVIETRHCFFLLIIYLQRKNYKLHWTWQNVKISSRSSNFQYGGCFCPTSQCACVFLFCSMEGMGNCRRHLLI